MLNLELRIKFKKLYLDKFNIDLTDEQATEMATDLIYLVKVLLKPDPKPDEVISNLEERSENETIEAQQFQ